MHNMVIFILHSKTENTARCMCTYPRVHRTTKPVFAFFFNALLLDSQRSMCKCLRSTKFQQSHEHFLLKSAVQMHANYRRLQSIGYLCQEKYFYIKDEVKKQHILVHFCTQDKHKLCSKKKNIAIPFSVMYTCFVINVHTKKGSHRNRNILGLRHLSGHIQANICKKHGDLAPLMVLCITVKWIATSA